MSLTPQGERAHLESTPSEDGLRRMAEAIGGRVVDKVLRLGGGLDASTHMFELDGERLVVKRSRPGTTGAAVEFENLQHAWRALVPTPAPVALDADGTWFDTPAIVMSALPGVHNLFPFDEEQWLREMAHALAAVHDTPIDGFARRRPPRWERWEPWSEELDDRVESVERAIEDLTTLARGARPVFSHDDFHPGNLVFVGDSLSGVVDWAQAELEPRQSAVAYCRKDLALHPGGDAPDRFLAAYEAEVGFRLADMELWDILQGARALQWGHRWPPAFAELGVDINADDIWHASVTFTDQALARHRQRQAAERTEPP